MSGTTESRTIEIVARVRDLGSPALRNLATRVQSFATKATAQFATLTKSLLSVRTAFSLLVGGFAAFKGGQAVVGVVQASEQLRALAASTGSSVESLSVLQQAFAQANIDGTKFRQVMNVLSRSIGQALGDGTSKAADSFRKLGISVDDLRSSDPATIFSRMAKALEQFATPQERVAALVEVFPNAAEGAEAFVEVLGQGEEKFQSLVKSAAFFGGTLTKDGAEQVGRLKASFDALSLSLGKVARSATIALAERLSPLFEKLATFFAMNGERIGQAIGAIASALLELSLKVAAAFLRLVAFLNSNGEKIVELLEEIPFVGKKAAETMREIFDTRRIVPGARAIRDELTKVADKERELILRMEELRASVKFEETSGDWVNANKIEEANREIARLERWRQDLYQNMLKLEQDFIAEQSRLGGKPVANELERQREAAQMRAMAGSIFQLDQFSSLPAPPTDLSPMSLLLFGQGGMSEWEAKQERARAEALRKAAEVAEKMKSISGRFDLFTDGFREQRDEIRRQWSDFGAAGREAASSIVDGGLNGLTDAMADLITRQKSAKDAFRDFARAVLADLARVASKLAVMQFLSGFGLGLSPVAAPAAPALEKGGILPGNVQGTVPLRKFANGGIVKRPTLALFGEGKASRGEAFVPLPDGRRIPVALTGGGGGGVMNITIQAMDGADVQRVLLQNRGTLRAVWGDDLRRMQAVRQTVKGAVQ